MCVFILVLAVFGVFVYYGFIRPRQQRDYTQVPPSPPRRPRPPREDEGDERPRPEE